MEIKVYKDVSKREKLYAGNMTFPQLVFIFVTFAIFAIGLVNAFFWHLPDPLIMIPSFLIIGFLFAFSMWKPYGLPFFHWIKLWFKFNTTIQKRTYGMERNKKYQANDFKKQKNKRKK